MWMAADQIVSSYREEIFPLFVSLAQAMREVNKIKQNKTPERLCIVVLVSIMSHPRRRRKRHHHSIFTDLKYGEDCTVMFLGTTLSALVRVFG